MAVLTVLAAFAFQVRADGGMPGWWAAAMSVPVLEPMSGMPGMPMAGHMGHETAQSEASGGSLPATEKAHNHGAHCPFCVTNAFALDDAPFVVWAGRDFGVWQQDLAHPVNIPRLDQHADARAPPTLPLSAA